MVSKMADDEIVISGMAGRFPNAKNTAELAHNLYNKVDMVDDSEKRWRHTFSEIPKRMGKIPSLEKFDAMFFGVHFKQVNSMDPQNRLLIEHAYEAILDAGVSPKSLRGSKTGVFVGAGFTESEQTWYYDKVPASGFGITGCSRAMFANRVSYSLGLNGPSFLLDTACSSSMYALDMAYKAISDGYCDAALVGASNLLLHYDTTRQFSLLGVLAPDGFCCPFDVNATGYTRSEAVSVLFLQKAKDAKRVYGSVVYSKTNFDGFKEDGIIYPSDFMQTQLLTEFYQDIGIDPASVAYVEANGTGIAIGDSIECSVLDKVFCKTRKTPLAVGSVKSNIGHSEAAAGCCSITKALLAFDKKEIAPNINFTECRKDIPALNEGRIKVVTETAPLEGTLIAINGFGYSGSNAHCLLRAGAKEKINFGLPKNKLPILVTWSGRTEEGVHKMLDDITKRPIDVEHVALLHNIQQETTPSYVYRGFALYEQKESENASSLSKEIQHFTGLKRPLVFVFSGMGSQWCEMGASLMNIPIFRESIQKSHNVMQKHGLDLINILTSPDLTMYDNILHSFVGIAAIQIALVDILNVLGIKPDYIVGHSVGELGCAYADGCFTAEQMIMAAYSRGLVSLETKVVLGSMAAVGMGYRKILTMIPSGIEVACHNSSDSCTLSGPAENVSELVTQLKRKGIFAKEVPCSNIPYHSKYISEFGPKLLARLKEIIPNPIKRSAKWLSSSVPKIRWDLPESQLCSAEYHTNNLLSSVLFEETTALLPKNSLTIEVAPHKLLQGILKQSMPKSIHIGLTQRGSKENAQCLFNAFGQLYNNGLEMPINKLYPPVEFPVSRGTAMISPMICWDHSEDWFVSKFESKKAKKISERKVVVLLSEKDFEYMDGNKIDGRIIFPAAGYLQLVWETLALMKGRLNSDLEVEFNDVNFLRQTVLVEDLKMELVIMIQPGTGRFEIAEDANAIVTGYIKEVENSLLIDIPKIEEIESPKLSNNDFYKELHLRGYQYNGQFRSVMEATQDGLKGAVKWEHNWVSFLDSLIQIHIFGEDTRSLMLPTAIQKLLINPKEHTSIVRELDPVETILPVEASRYLNKLRCGGIEMCGLLVSPVNRRNLTGHIVLGNYTFIPHLSTPIMSQREALRVLTQLALENCPTPKVKAIEIDIERKKPIITKLLDVISDLPDVTADMILFSSKNITLNEIHVENGKLATQTNCTFIIAVECLNNSLFLQQANLSLREGGYIVSREKSGLTVQKVTVPSGFQLLATIPTAEETLVLIQRQKSKMSVAPQIITTTTENYNWLSEVRNAMKKGPVVLLAENDKMSGVVGMVNCIRKEANGQSISVVFIDDSKAPPFELNHPLYKDHLQLGLAINVFKDGRWGSYRHLQLTQQLKMEKRKDHCYASTFEQGDISSLRWMLGPFNCHRPKGELIRIRYAALNHRDVQLASGNLTTTFVGTDRMKEDYLLGCEYSGISERGRRVMGMSKSGALATYVEADDTLTWECPNHWTLEQAATIPVVYGTVYYAFFIVGQISKGKSILIHSGTGDVGLAAIRVAFAYGLNVYTSVDTREKRQFLLSIFPTLKHENIVSSRDTSFEKMIMLRTKGKGVDFVLNSLAGDKLHASIRCVGQGGKLLEIGKVDMANDTSMGLGQFLKEISFHAVLIENMLSATPPVKEALRLIIDKDIQSGVIKPLNTTLFSANEIEKAFRYLVSSKNMGKVLCQIRDNDKDEFTTPITVIPKVYCSSQLSYVICGGSDGFGLELADWLIIRGCRKLILNSSGGNCKQYQAFRTNVWKSYGVEVKNSKANITTKNGCKALLMEAAEMGPVGGIFNLAATLRDSNFENLNEQMFLECMGPKFIATKVLDEASKKFCPRLQYFVVFSCMSSGRGNPGQSNYGMANNMMEKIIRQRYLQGLPAKAVQWGTLENFDVSAATPEETDEKSKQKISSCLQQLDILLTSREPIVSSMFVAKKRNPTGKSIINTVTNIMNIPDTKSLQMNLTLLELDIDSLMAAEIKQILERELDVIFTIQDIYSLTFEKLKQFSENKGNNTTEGRLKLASGEIPICVAMLLRNAGNDCSREQKIIRIESKNNSKLFSTCVLLIPGLESVAGSTWNEIASLISIPTYALQLATKLKNISTMSEIDSALAENIKMEVFKQTEFFYLVGYSFGAFATLELAKILEESGMSGHVVLIDGAPEFLKKLAIKQVGETYNDESLQLILLAEIMRAIIPGNNVGMLKTIQECSTWQDRVEKIVRLTKEQSVFSETCVRQMINSVFNRIKISLEIDLEKITPIRSPITLLRPTEVSLIKIDEDYGLRKCTEGQVNLKFIEGNHMTMLENLKLIQIINEMDPFLESNMQFNKYIGM